MTSEQILEEITTANNQVHDTHLTKDKMIEELKKANYNIQARLRDYRTSRRVIMSINWANSPQGNSFWEPIHTYLRHNKDIGKKRPLKLKSYKLRSK